LSKSIPNASIAASAALSLFAFALGFPAALLPFWAFAAFGADLGALTIFGVLATVRGVCSIMIHRIGDTAMTLTELEIRVATIEQKLARLTGKVDAPESPNINSWIDQIHGIFQNDATYRQAACLGHEWHKSQRRRATSRSRQIAGK